ncbi:DNA polymerase III subunit chi [Teredinibacter haidensis]|uniref:DNA polymerase III subunit chi n=1 Tax=Teredinibacter haidensis TaxID=2731755 RepID=UPI000948FDD8|nr:DNA polymerase III subunit chi [Teredinibacter haidensis]
MTRIDFYILQKSEVAARHHFACRLVDKAVSQGNRVMIATNNEDESQLVDELLWSFRPESFVPHGQLTDHNADKSAVIISHEDDDPGHHHLLVNLRNNVPPEFSRFKRLAEIVVQETRVLETTRQHYTFYKSRGYELNNHQLP